VQQPCGGPYNCWTPRCWTRHWATGPCANSPPRWTSAARRAARRSRRAASGAAVAASGAAVVTGHARLRAVAVDGKAVRGAQTHGTALHLVSMVTHAQAITVAQRAVAAKSNEIPAVQHLLGERDLRGWVVTLDALHTQRETAEVIRRQGGHYLMVVKQNQPTRDAELQAWFAEPAARAEQEHRQEVRGKAHGRLERRTLAQRQIRPCGRRDWLAFPGARQGLARTCWAQIRTTGRERAAVTYGLTSLSPDDVTLAELETLWRGHWTIEHRSHYVRDVTCGEDAGQAWVGHTPHVLATLRNGALALFRLAGWTTMAAAFRHTAAQVSRAFRLLGCAPSPA
jgi:predicted transposase YbfD/YdcC